MNYSFGIIILATVSFVASFQEENSNVEKNLLLLSNFEADTDHNIGEGAQTNEGVDQLDEENDFAFGFDLKILTDSWWKISIWCVGIFLIVCLVAFFSRLCFLVWDCCTDTYWGCCPRYECCKTLCLLKCCERKKSKRVKKNQFYDFVSEEDEAINSISSAPHTSAPPPFVSVRPATEPAEDHEELREEDFTLRTLENSEEQPLNNNTQKTGDSCNDIQTSEIISNISTLERPNNLNLSKVHNFCTSTPMRPLARMQDDHDDDGQSKRINSLFLGQGTDLESGNDESLPQIHEGHYFNVFNLFKVGGARYEYSVARKQSQISNQSLELHNHSFEKRRRVNDSKFTMYSGIASNSHDTSTEIETPLLTPRSVNRQWQQFENQDGHEKSSKKKTKENKKTSKSHQDVDHFLAANQNDFLLSNSFSNMSSSNAQTPTASKSQRSYGLFIEEGQAGRYNPLPEAQSELWPPHQLEKLRSQASSRAPSVDGNTDYSHRRSRSMDAIPKSGPRQPKQPARQTRPLVGNGGEAKSQIDVCNYVGSQSADRRRPPRTHNGPGHPRTMESKSLQTIDNGELETSHHRRQDRGFGRKPPPVPILKSPRRENGHYPQHPPTPPPPLIEDSPPKIIGHKRLHSLDEILDFEKNILYGRETTL